MLSGEPFAKSRPTASNSRSKSVRAWQHFSESTERRWPLCDSSSHGLSSVPIDWEALLTGIASGRTNPGFEANRDIFTQGEPADAVYLVVQGLVKLTVVSQNGKGAIVATLGPGDVFGEGCLIGQPVRMATATCMETCRVTRVEKTAILRVLHNSPPLAAALIANLLSRIARYEADLVDHVFSSAAKRLARVLVRLSQFGGDGGSETVVTNVNQEHLAQMVGSTRSRINRFMTTFRKLGFISYGNQGGLTVHRSLQRMIESD